MKTRAQLVQKALDILGVTAVGQTPDADTAKIIDDDLDAVLKSLASRELIYLPDPDNTPDDVFIPLAVLVGDANKHNFGLQQDELDRLSAAVLQAESQIREIVRGRPTFEALRIAYY